MLIRIALFDIFPSLEITCIGEHFIEPLGKESYLKTEKNSKILTYTYVCCTDTAVDTASTRCLHPAFVLSYLDLPEHCALDFRAQSLIAIEGCKMATAVVGEKSKVDTAGDYQ